MSSRGSPGRPREVRRDQRQIQDFEGVNTLVHAATFASYSSTSESYPDQEDARRRTGTSLTRESSASSSTSPARKNPGSRPPRPTYTQEQEDAIRFHRDDLSMTWTQVEEAYNGLCYADGTPWERRTISGLQSRYYRLLPMPVNETKKQAKPRPELGILLMAPERRYWWMSTSQMTPEERVQNATYNENAEYSGCKEYGDLDEAEEDIKSHD